MLCYAMLYHAIPCNTMLYHAIPCYTMLYHAIPCYVMLIPSHNALCILHDAKDIPQNGDESNIAEVRGNIAELNIAELNL